ncbi:MAG TPA: GtrA family protein [Nocardioides sp.]|uniref:GtrA family protein n=1 Tax=Nocardioides sp. TaxID=35761 RepID=UPI002F423DBC
MPTRLPHIVVEIGRFMVTGGLSTLTSFLVFNFLAHGLYITSHPWLVKHAIAAFVIANVFGMLVSYQLSRHWTFQHRPPVHPDGGRTAFFVINLVTMPLAIACLWVSRHVLGLTDPFSDNIAGNVVGQLLGQAARFYLFRRFVFRQPVHATDLAHHPASLLGPARPLLDPERSSEDRV